MFKNRKPCKIHHINRKQRKKKLQVRKHSCTSLPPRLLQDKTPGRQILIFTRYKNIKLPPSPLLPPCPLPPLRGPSQPENTNHYELLQSDKLQEERGILAGGCLIVQGMWQSRQMSQSVSGVEGHTAFYKGSQVLPEIRLFGVFFPDLSLQPRAFHRFRNIVIFPQKNK